MRIGSLKRHFPTPRPLTTVVLALVLAGGLASCSGGSGPAVTIYSGRTEALVAPVLERFARETGIDVKVRYGQSTDLALLLDQEAARSPADVFLSQSPGPMGFLAEKGHLSRLSTETLELADEKARSGRGLWVGVTGRIRVLVYNTRLVRPQELPRSVFDLTGPAYRDRVAVAPANASFQDFVTGMRLKTSDAQALEWLRGMKANGARTYANNLAIVEAVGRGEVPMGLVNHYYNHQVKAQDPGLPTENHVFPDGDLGAMNLISGAAVLSSSRRPELAERLVRFLLDDESQRYFAQETYEYPLAAGVPAVAGLPPLDQLNTPVFDADALGGGLTRTKELLDASGIEHA